MSSLTIKRLLRWLTHSAAVVLLAGSASAGTVWNNGGPNSLGGNEIGDLNGAEDFIITAQSDLTAISFWSLEASGSYLGSITWSIQANTSNVPGAVIASGNIAPTRTNLGAVPALGTNPSLTLFQNNFAINVAALSAGTYWLVLHDGLSTDTALQDFYWAWANLNGTNTGTNRGLEQDATLTDPSWNTNSNEHAFLLSGAPTPEPATMVLLSAGLAALWLAGRKRNSKGGYR